MAEEDKYPYEKEDHFRFAFVADEWLMLYSDCPVPLVLPQVFAMVMTFELYLKAYYSKLTQNIPNSKNATKFSHNYPKLLKEIKQIDEDRFPSILTFNHSLLTYPLFELDRNGWNCEWYKNLAEIDQAELKNNYEFYLIMAYGIDLKYGISPSLEKHGGRVISSNWSNLNPRLAEIVLFIRNRIGFPDHSSFDLLRHKIDIGGLPELSFKFLHNIVDQTTYKVN